MENYSTACPVCTLFLREGVTLQDHLGTHPKEQVIEALLRITGEVSTPHMSAGPTNSSYVPVQSVTNSNSFVQQPPQTVLGINPQPQMTTAVTYQHFMTSNGSTVMPQYMIMNSGSNSIPVISNPGSNSIRIPIISNPGSNSIRIPIISNPGSNSIRIPIISTSVSNNIPIISNSGSNNIPIISNSDSNNIPVISNSGSSNIPVISNSGSNNIPIISNSGNNSIPIISNSVNLVPNQTVNYSQTTYNPLYNPYIPQPYPFTQQIYTNCSSANSNTETSNFSSSQDQSETLQEENVSVKTRSVATSTNAGRKIRKVKSKKLFLRHAPTRRKAKVLKFKSESSRALEKSNSLTVKSSTRLKTVKSKVSARTKSGIISPPPLTLIKGPSNNSLSRRTAPSPPPLSKAPCFEVVNVDKGEDVTDSVAPNVIPEEPEMAFLDHQSKSKDPDSDYTNIEAEIKIFTEIKEMENEPPNECQKDPLGMDVGENPNGESEDDKQDEEEKQEDIFQMLEVTEDKKIDITASAMSEDIPNEISSQNIESNCDDSDIFIQQENILFRESPEKEKNDYSDFMEGSEAERTPTSVEKIHKEYEFDPEEDDSRFPPRETPVTYTDLQPAKCTKVYQELGISPYINLSNYMEVDGIKIIFNNSATNVPIDPVMKLTNTDNSVMKTENQVTNSSVVDSSIPVVSGESDTKGDIPLRENYSATTSQINEVQLDIPDLSPLGLNIQTDESMPARGELSEQESLGAENSSWNLFHGNSTNETNTLEEWRNDTPQLVSVVEDKKPPKSFKCSTCSEVFSCPKERRVHRNTVHLGKAKKRFSSRKSKKYACNFCSDVFTNLRNRKVHVFRTHTQEVKNKGSDEGKKDSEVVITGGTPERNETVRENRTKTEENISPGETISIRVKYCTRCSSPFVAMKKLREHLRLVHGEIRFKCEECSACFDDQNDYNEHLLVHPLSCVECGKTFHKKPNLRLHMKRHLSVKPYECSVCPKSFITRQKLEEHLNSHSGKKPLKCTFCDKSFSRHSNLVQHRKLHHVNRKKIRDFVCRCGEVFHSPKKLEWHKEVHEPKPKPCPYCSQKFIHKASVTRHIRRAHLPDYLPGENREFENVQCPICEKIYLRSTLSLHMRSVHNGEKPFPCKICNKRFSTKWNLEIHNWTHQSRSNMPFKCTMCKRAFFRDVDFVAHMNSHRNYKPFTCNICGQKFIRKYTCLRHQNEHKKTKQYVCGVTGCAKSFHRCYYLRDHMKVHTGVRPHTCHICGKASSTKSNHNKHVRIHDTREPINTEN